MDGGEHGARRREDHRPGEDFRDESGGFVYGLPELNRDRIRTAQRVANPGCFATAIQLALLRSQRRDY